MVRARKARKSESQTTSRISDLTADKSHLDLKNTNSVPLLHYTVDYFLCVSDLD